MTAACWWYAVAGAVGMLVLMAVLSAVLLYAETRETDPLRNRERVGR
jgi:hypothetical protein